jgi:hypothetical protein
VLTQKNEPLLAQVGVNIDQANQQLILTYPAMDQLTLSLAPDLTQQMDGSFCTGKKKQIASIINPLRFFVIKLHFK